VEADDDSITLMRGLGERERVAMLVRERDEGAHAQ
jgi:hypothetical protein